MCVERLFLGQEPKLLRATQQLEREGKAGEKRGGGRCQGKASLWSQEPPGTELERGE